MALERPRYDSYRFVVGGLLLAAHFAVGLNFYVVSPLLPLIIEDYSINNATASLLVGLPLLLHACFGLPGGILAVRLGLRRVYAISWFMVGASVLAAVAPDYLSLLALRLLYGIGFGAMVPATGPVLMQWFRPREIPIMNGLNLAVLSLGIALSVATAAPLADALGWQNSLGLFGGIALAGAFAWTFLSRTRRDGYSVNPSISLGDIAAVFRNRTIILLVVADAMVFMAYTALTSWLPTFYNESRGMSLTQAGFVLGLLPFVGVFGVLLGGLLPLRIESKRVFFIVPGIMVGLGGLGAFLMESTAGIYISIILLGLGSWLYAPTLLSLPMELPGMTPGRVAIAWGSIVTVTGTGMFLSPLVVGILRDASGTFLPGFWIFGVLAWSMLFIGFLLPKSDAPKARWPESVPSPP